MKKLLLSLLLAGSSMAAFAQLPTFGIKGGANFSTLHISLDGTNISVNSGTLTTFNAGVFVDFKFGNVSLQPALNLSGKGGKFGGVFSDTEDSNIEQGDGRFNLIYLQLPVNLVYHVPVVVGDIYFGAGPYVAKGISGKVKGNDSDGNSVSEDIKFGDDGDIKSMEYGANAIAGIKFKTGLLFNVNYDLGLSNIAPNADGGKLKTRVFGISVGYAF
ncbi:porin family protein [Mucilaginibacter sabulilitoris]|uniref:Porin family protein n=1 Tax=Mucilaginibacter sabulilitoris TaxID=1173583 RepID=A0ABZ0TK30_9SPHI|nr:porin family protein [Mucilaginibacter sabulilitoris]WPU92538.1 porin family protein [Mucilaginibacter sabulilitoris]